MSHFSQLLNSVATVQECDARNGEGSNAAEYIKILTGGKFTVFQVDSETHQQLKILVYEIIFCRVKYLL